MKRRDAAFRRKFAAGLLVSLLLGSPAVLAQKKPQKAAPKAGSDRGESEGDAVRRREEWFYKQRRYPLGFIPGGARQRALDRVEEMRRAQRVAKANRPAPDALAGSSAPAPLSPSTTWTHVGPMPALSAEPGVSFVSGRVSAIAADPTNANTVFVGGAQGGVWKSVDGGATWATTFDGSKSLAIGAIGIDPSNPNTVYVGTGEQNFSGDSYYGVGIYKSIDSGATWIQIPGETILNPQAGAPNSFLPPAAPFNEVVGGVHISSIVVHPAHPMKVFAGVQIFINVDGGASSGLYCSDDAGQTWTQVLHGAVGTDIQIHPASIGGNIGSVAYAALGSLNGDTSTADPTGQNGVYKTAQANTLCTNQVPGQPGAWTLVSTGAVFPQGINAGLIRIGVAPSDGTAKTVYAAVGVPFTATNQTDALAGVFKTTDGGNTWTTVTLPTIGSPPINFCDPQCSYDLVVKVRPDSANTVFLGGSRTGNGTANPIYLIASTDGGTTWNQIARDSLGTRLHEDQHALAFGLTGTGAPKMYVGNDGGIWSTALPASLPPAPGSAITSNSIAWNNLNSGLEMIQFYPGLSIHPATNQITYAGTQDNGTEKMDTTGSSTNPLEWTELDPCGDGGYNAIDPSTPSTVYVACQDISILKSTANGAAGTFLSIDGSISQSDRSEFIPPLVIDSLNTQWLYFGTFRVWQTMNGGATWNAISPDLTSGAANLDDITSLSVSPKNSNVVYVGTFGSGTSGTVVQRTTQANLGAGALNTWVKIDGGTLPPRTITQVAGDPNNQDVVFVTMSGFNGFMINPPATDTQGHVFRCSAVAPVGCTDISGTGLGALPNTPVNAIVVDPIDPTSSTIYIGTDVGVFGTKDGGNNWIVDFPGMPNGLPNVAVLGIAIHPGTRVLRVVTHGRSAWDLQLPGLPAYGVTSISPTSAAAGSTSVTLTVNGNGFTTNSSVQFNGQLVITTFVSATQLTGLVDAPLLTTTGTVQVNVVDTNLGTTPTSLPFTIVTPTPTVTASAPPSTPVNTAVTLTITGTNFIPSSVVRINNNGGSVSDTLSLTAANITNGGTTITVTVPATAQSVQNPGTYFISVFNPPPGGGDSSGGTQVPPNFTVTPANNNPPPNDGFNNAINCAGNGTCDTTNNVNATTNTGGVTDPAPSCVQGSLGLAGSGNAKSIWYKFTANGPGTITVDTIGSLDDTILSAFTGGPPAAFAEVACNDDINPGVIRTSQMSFPATQGTTYFFMVSSFDGFGGKVIFNLNSSIAGPADFTASANPTSASVSRGRSASTTLSLAPTGSLYPGTVACKCLGLPSEAFCIFTPTSVGQAAGATMVNLTITTTAPSTAPPLARRGPWSRPMGVILWALAALLSLGLLAVPRAARRLRHALTVVLLMVLSGLAVSCGGGGGGGGIRDPGTPTGTFMVTVQSQSGNVTHTLPYTLTVTP